MILLGHSRLFSLPISVVSLSIASFWITPGTLVRSAVWSPEAFAFPLSVWLLLSAVLWSRGNAKGALLLGATIGLAVSFKLTFLSRAAAGEIYLLLLPNSRPIRNLTHFLSGFFAAFLLATLLAFRRYPDFLSHILTILSGSHPDLGVASVDEAHGFLSRWTDAFQTVLSFATGWAALTLSALGVLTFAYFRANWNALGTSIRRNLARMLLPLRSFFFKRPCFPGGGKATT